MKLSQDAVAKIKRAEAGKAEHIEWDDALPGFGLRIRNGRSTWIVQYKIGTQNRRVTLGTTEMLTAEQARKGWETENGERRDGADKIMVDARNGIDAAVSRATRRKEASKTFSVTVGEYLKAKRGEISHNYDVALTYHLEVLLKPLNTFALASISRAAVAAEIRTIAKERGAATANRARGSLSALFRWAIGEGLCDNNPVVGTNQHEENEPRQRSLSDEEIAAIWQAAPTNDYGKIIRLLMLTGCRREEIGSLKWSEIDLEANTVMLPATRTKNKQQHIVPLCAAAAKILTDVPRRAERDFVFGTGDGGYAGWSKGKTAIDKIVKLKTPWTVHDIRRTVRTGLAGLGVLPWVAEAVLNHLPPKLVRTYAVSGGETETNFDKKLEAEKRTALDLWASHLAIAIARADGANITALVRKTEAAG